jgi:hypothetical protein
MVRRVLLCGRVQEHARVLESHHDKEKEQVKKILLATLVFGSVTQASAQACLGLPTFPGQFSLSGAVETQTTTVAGYRADVVAHTPFGVSLGANYRFDEHPEITPTGHTFGGLLAAELPMPVSSICPIVEAQYSIFDGETAAGTRHHNATTLRIPATIGVGQRIDFLDAFYAVPNARAGVVHARHRAGEGTAATTVTYNSVLIGAGLSVGRGVAYLTTGGTVSTEPDTEPRFHLGLGIVLP